jgi:hypothetical protein
MGSAEALQLAGRRLQGVYESDSTLRVVLDHFSTRSKNSDETTVDALQGALKQEGHSVEYGQAREALKKLAQATDSRFIRGRRGAKTRVHWKFSIIEMGKVARAHIGARGAARAPTSNGHNS